MHGMHSQLFLALQIIRSSILDRMTSGNLTLVAAIIFIVWISIRFLSKLFNLLARQIPRSRFVMRLLEPATRIGLWFLAIFLVIKILAPTQETFFASVASIGLAFGLGAQDLIKNVIGGLVVLIDRPYQLGDRVRIGEAYGEIDQVGLRSTKLTTQDDTRVTIPNMDILNQKVFNANSGVPDCQVVTDLFLPPETDPDVAMRIGYEAAACSPFLLARKPIVSLVSHGFDRRPYLRLRIKAYVYDHRYEPRLMSDVTSRAAKEFIRLGVLKGWKHDGTDLAGQ
jgi:MscS family membrane protein